MSGTPATRRSHRGRVLHAIGVIIMVGYLTVPFVWMVAYSVYPSSALTQRQPNLSPSLLTLDSYRSVLGDGSFRDSLVNSLIVALVTTCICMILGSMCAYGIALYRFRGRQSVLLTMMTVQAIPVVVLAVPLFVLLRGMGLYDTHIGLIVTYCAFILPLVVWMTVSFMERTPATLIRAARVDGCNRWQAMYRIAFPLAASGLAATSIFAFITAWSDFFLAKILTSTKALTVPVRTANYQGLFQIDYAAAATAGVIATVPVLILALVAQRWIIQGLTEGAVKG